MTEEPNALRASQMLAQQSNLERATAAFRLKLQEKGFVFVGDEAYPPAGMDEFAVRELTEAAREQAFAEARRAGLSVVPATVDVAPREPVGPSYLGDGVYASHDGYQVWLSLDSSQPQMIAVNPETLERLLAYARRAGVAR